MPFGLRTWVGPGNHVLYGGPDLRMERVKMTLCHELCKYGWTDRFAIWVVDWLGRRKHMFHRIRQVAPMCSCRRTHCCHLVNVFEPFVCSVDAALCQIALTTCWNIVIFLWPNISRELFVGKVTGISPRSWASCGIVYVMTYWATLIASHKDGRVAWASYDEMWQVSTQLSVGWFVELLLSVEYICIIYTVSEKYTL